MKENKFIVLEGLSGTGKTTIANYLEKELGFDYFYLPTTEMKAIRKYVHSTDLQTRFLYYLAVASAASLQIKEALKSNNVVADRYIYSTLAYHQAAGLSSGLITLGENIKLIKPHEVFHIKLSRELRHQRLIERGEIIGDEWEKDHDRNRQAKSYFSYIATKTIFNNGLKEELYASVKASLSF